MHTTRNFSCFVIEPRNQSENRDSDQQGNKPRLYMISNKCPDVIVLNPYFFSMTKVSYKLKGIFIISDANPIIPKKMSEMITGLELIDLASSSTQSKSPGNDHSKDIQQD